MKRCFEFRVVIDLGRWYSSEELLKKLKDSELKFANFKHDVVKGDACFTSVCIDHDRESAEESIWEYIELDLNIAVFSITFIGTISHEEYESKY